MIIPFNKIFFNEEIIVNIKECFLKTRVSSDNKYSKLCESWFKEEYLTKTLLTVSCTAALEMSAILSEINAGDEVIMPSFTFVSTANAFVLRGAIPVFIDINPKTQNIDENLIEKAITKRTKAIVVVHYAGIACNMAKILEIAKKYNLIVIEDAAHTIGAKYDGKYLGSIGDIGCLSFHETKNITSGEGGAIIINNNKYSKFADLISEKGTNRKAFIVGETDKYTWLNIGSSYKMSDINAAVLYSQLLVYDKIMKKRLYIWNAYLNFFKFYEEKGYIKCPFVPDYAEHNGHIFYILFNKNKARNEFINYMKEYDIDVKFHYIPLHSSPAGKQFGKTPLSMVNTDKTAETLVRLPLFYDLTDEQINYIFSISKKFFKERFV